MKAGFSLGPSACLTSQRALCHGAKSIENKVQEHFEEDIRGFYTTEGEPLGGLRVWEDAKVVRFPTCGTTRIAQDSLAAGQDEMQMQVSMSQTTLYEAGPSSLRTMNSTTLLFGLPFSSSQKPNVRFRSLRSTTLATTQVGQLHVSAACPTSKPDINRATIQPPPRQHSSRPAAACGQRPLTPILALGLALLSSQAKLPP